MRFGKLAALFAVILVVIGTFAVLVVQGQSYKVQFIDKSLTMDPPRAGQGLRVTFSFSVNNDGATLKKVQIRVVQPCDARGEGRVLVDLPNQTIGRGTNTFQVSGVFQAPTGDKNFLQVVLFDRKTSASPPPVITRSGLRQVAPVTFKLGPAVPSS